MPPEAAADPALLAVISAGGGLCQVPWRWLGCGQAGCGAVRSAGGPVNVCARWRSVLRPWDLPCSPASCASPRPSKAHGCIFFLFFLAFSSIFSLSPPFFPSLSLFLWFFFFLFFFQKIKARKGEGSKEKAQERPVQTTQLVRLCPLLVDSLPSLSPNQTACLLLTQNLTFPSQSLVGCRSCRGSAGGGTALALRAAQGRWL